MPDRLRPPGVPFRPRRVALGGYRALPCRRQADRGTRCSSEGDSLTVVIAGPDEVRILDGRARVTLCTIDIDAKDVTLYAVQRMSKWDIMVYSGHVRHGTVHNVAKVSLLEGGPSIGWTARKGPKVEKPIKTRGKNA